MENRDALEAAMNALLTTKTTNDWVEVLEAAGVPCGPVYDYAQMFADPQVRHRGLVQYASDAELGEVPHIRTPIRVGDGVRVRAVAPKLGQHNAEIFAGSGSARRKRPDCAPAAYCGPAASTIALVIRCRCFHRSRQPGIRNPNRFRPFARTRMQPLVRATRDIRSRVQPTGRNPEAIERTAEEPALHRVARHSERCAEVFTRRLVPGAPQFKLAARASRLDMRRGHRERMTHGPRRRQKGTDGLSWTLGWGLIILGRATP